MYAIYLGVQRNVQFEASSSMYSIYQVRFTTLSVSTSSALLASLTGSNSSTSLAFSAYARASSRVRATPEDLRTRSRACVTGLIQRSYAAVQEMPLTSSTSPGCSNLRAMSGPISGCSSHAYKAGPVVRPRCKSAPPGFPIASSPDS